MGNSSESILALDAGTQSVRAIIFDLAGNMLGLRKESLPPWDAPSPGWAETPAEAFWENCAPPCRGCGRTTRS